MPKIKHLAIRTEDTGKLATFYMDVFEMQVLHKDKREGDAIYLTDGYFNLAILPNREQNSPNGLYHFGFEVESGEKIDWLATFAKRDSDGPVLVFVRRKIDADRVARHLVAKSIKAAALHADRTQQERLSAVEGFRSGKHPVLVATDIAAREIGRASCRERVY